MNSKQTNIERAPKNNDNPYGMLRRAAFDGSGLSFEARGVLAYILMKPDNWKTNITDLMREGDIGRDKAYGIVNELIDKGYAERVEDRDIKGNFAGTTIKIHEQPLPENPDTDLPDTVQPHTENTEHNNKGILPITDQLPIQSPIDTSLRSVSPPPNPTQAILRVYEEALNYKPTNYGKEGKAAKELAKRGYTPEDVVVAYHALKKRPFWASQHLSLTVVLENIAALGNYANNGGDINSIGRPKNKADQNQAAFEEFEKVLKDNGLWNS